MSPVSASSHTLPWQVGPVSSLGRITAGALVALALDLAFAWQASPSIVLSLALIIGPLVVAVRVVRGFEGSLPTAVTTFAFAILFSAAGLILGSSRGAVHSALIVGTLLSVVGGVAAVAAWMESRRSSEPPVIEIAPPSRDGLARARTRPRVYR